LFHVKKAFALFNANIPVVIVDPGTTQLTVLFPGSFIGFAFKDAAIVFPEGIGNLVGQPQGIGKDVSGLGGAQ
jgi:hypothetical protein